MLGNSRKGIPKEFFYRLDFGTLWTKVYIFSINISIKNLGVAVSTLPSQNNGLHKYTRSSGKNIRLLSHDTTRTE
jgi:hypothetical protein